jgi:sterol desaturase/sphingolipid hydroxylase (fatty acid hydroxylase superfamily)
MKAQSARIFENEILEGLTRSHPVFNTAVGVALAGVCVARAPLLQLGLATSIGIVLATIGSWTLIEYLTHRYLFHWTPRNPAVRRALYLMHEYHHDYPGDLARDMFPLVVSLPMALIAWLVMWTALPGDTSLLAFATIVLCFTAYDLFHYMHHASPRFIPALRRRHMLHHFQYPEANYGVTSTLWDHVFGTIDSRRGSRAPAPEA